MFCLEAVERIAQGKHDLRIFRADFRVHLQVRCLDVVYVAGRAEQVLKCKRCGQAAVEQLLADGYIGIPEGIASALCRDRGADEAAIELQARIFPQSEKVVPKDVVIGAGCLFPAGSQLVDDLVVVDVAVERRVPPAGGVDVQAEFKPGGIVLADVGHHS